MVVGLLVLVGWASGSELLTRLNRNFPAMNPATAICIILSGSAIALHLLKRRRWAMLLGGLVAAAGAAKLFDLAIGGIPFDTLLFSGFLEAGLGPPNRMAPNTALAFVLVGVALQLVSSVRRTLQLLSQTFAILALLASLFAIIGYGYGIEQLSGISSFIPMALHTAISLAVISAAILTLTPTIGLMVLLRDTGPAGSMTRTVLPLAVAIPIALGGARMWGQNAGYYGTEVGIALQVVSNVAVTTALIIAMVFGLYRKDRTRKSRERILAQVAEKADWTASHDALTGLPNRAKLIANLDQRTGAAFSTSFAVLLIDVDDFRRINDTLGHEAGDAILKMVSKRVRRVLRPEDVIARLGGDEFAVILNEAGSRSAIQSAAEKIANSLREPWAFEGHLTDFQVRIGASICASDSDMATDLLNDADVALQSAKLHKQIPVAVFNPRMRTEIKKRAGQLVLAKRALAANLIVPFYQPKVELKSGKLIGFEALLRCRTEQGSVRPPSAIAAAFDELDISQQLTDRMLALCLSDMRRWLDQGIDFGHVAVNASAADFKRGNFAELILAGLQAEGIPPRHFQLEVTETVFLGRGADYVERALKLLSHHGVRIALDDFGTGYASLTHLKQFPVHVVKIDRSFVSDSDVDPQNAAIIRTVASLGQALGLDVVAEGVETANQRAYLMAHGCTIGQGFLFRKPASARGVPAIVRSCRKISAKQERPRRRSELRIARGG